MIWKETKLDLYRNIIIYLIIIRNIYGDNIVEVVDLGDRKMFMIISILIGIAIIFIMHKHFYS
jgi:hypothetical protein